MFEHVAQASLNVILMDLALAAVENSATSCFSLCEAFFTLVLLAYTLLFSSSASTRNPVAFGILSVAAKRIRTTETQMSSLSFIVSVGFSLLLVIAVHDV